MQCPVCQFENVPGLARCVRCQTALKLGGVAVEPPRSRRPPTRRRRAYHLARAGAGRRARLAAFLRRHGVERPFAGTDWDGVLWSVIPGLGHIRRGNRRVGRILLGVWAAALFAALLWAGTGWGWLFYMTAASVHGSTIAVFLSGFLRERGILARMFTGFAVFLILYVFAYMPLVRGASAVVRPLQIQGVGIAQELRNGDVLLYSGRLLRRGAFERGDLVVYAVRERAVRVHLDPGFNFIVRAGYWADRIIGLPGDRVEIRQGVLRVNEEAVPGDRGPVGGLQDLSDFSLTVPAYTFLVLPTEMLSRIVIPATILDRPGALQAAYARLVYIEEREVLGRVLWRTRPVSRFGPVN